jgi:hypothetical protein
VGKFTDWVESIKSDITDGVAGSVRFVHKALGIKASDAQIEKALARAQQAMRDVEAILVEAIDEIPGVPRIAAKGLAAGVGLGLQMAIAAAAEGAKTANDAADGTD